MKIKKGIMNKKRLNNGGTYDARTLRRVNLRVGYQVSVNNGNMDDNDELLILALLGIKKGYIGAWKNPSGKLEIERSFTIMDLNNALEIARRFKQYSIGDNKNKKEIVISVKK